MPLPAIIPPKNGLQSLCFLPVFSRCVICRSSVVVLLLAGSVLVFRTRGLHNFVYAILTHDLLSKYFLPNTSRPTVYACVPDSSVHVVATSSLHAMDAQDNAD